MRHSTKRKIFARYSLILRTSSSWTLKNKLVPSVHSPVLSTASSSISRATFSHNSNYSGMSDSPNSITFIPQWRAVKPPTQYGVHRLLYICSQKGLVQKYLIQFSPGERHERVNVSHHRAQTTTPGYSKRRPPGSRTATLGIAVIHDRPHDPFLATLHYRHAFHFTDILIVS